MAKKRFRIPKLWNPNSKWRWVRVGAAVVLLISVAIPTLQWVLSANIYALTPEMEQVVGSKNPNLSAKFSFDSSKQLWQFNKDGNAAQAEAIAKQQGSDPADVAGALKGLKAKQVGGSGKEDVSLYSVDLPVKGEQGAVYYDNQTNLSFKMIPQFEMQDGKLWEGRVVYPMEKGIKLVYTAKSNGLKEDIVMTKNLGDTLSYGYRLQLPSTLEARLLDDGSVGIFSADPTLFGNISFGSKEDEARVMDARKNALKKHLLFSIPAPVVKDQNGEAAHAVYTLQENVLQVHVNGLSKLAYPLSVDPSVVITSSSDFTAGNDEGMIDYSTSGQITRSGPSGGSTSAGWSTTTSLASPCSDRYGAGTVAYNGYMYVIGGNVNSTPVSGTCYAAINSNGTLGSWSTTSSMTTNRTYIKAIVYNGFMYAIAGQYDFTPTLLNSVEYAAINADGTLGTWKTTSSISVSRNGYAAGIYNGYIYIMGGWTGSGVLTTVEYAKFKADGTLGSWATTTAFTTARSTAGGFAYNGYLYILGGYNAASTYYNDVQYARINNDGTVGTWIATSSFTTSRAALTTVVSNGYVYLMGGTNDLSTGMNNTQYAPITASGRLGTWTTGSNLSTGYWAMGGATYNGYIYGIGGRLGSNSYTTVQYAQIDPTGTATAYTTSGNTFTTTRVGAQTVATSGYLYVMGGDNGGTPVNTIYKAPLNADGSIGTFASTTAFTTNRTFFAAVANNGYMYVLGGCSSAYASCTTAANNEATVYKSTINTANGTLGAWSAQTSFTTARYGLSAAVYNNYIYVMGGLNGSTFRNDIQYHAINQTNGNISGAWTTSANTMPNSQAYQAVTVNAGYIYTAGGCTAGALTCTTTVNTVHYAGLATSGDLSGAFASTNAFTNARGMFGIGVVNNYMYISGGLNNGTNYGDTQFAQINSNGTVGSWSGSSLSTLATNRYGIGMVANNGLLYVTGGYNGTTYYNNVHDARVNNVGGGGTGAWATGSAAVTLRTDASTVVYNGFIYNIGGIVRTTGADLTTSEYAPLNADGSTGSWTTDATHTFSNGYANRQYFAAVAYNGYMYIAGGCSFDNGIQYYKDIQYAPISPSGGYSGNWASAGGNINAGGCGPVLVAYNGYLYSMSGWDGSVNHADVQYAAINSNGTLGSWNTTTSFTTARSGAAAFAYNGYMYVMAGNGGADLKDVQYASINSNGTLNSWNYTTSLDIVYGSNLNVGAYNGFVYLVAGADDPDANDKDGTLFAPINSNGTIGRWQQAVPAPAGSEPGKLRNGSNQIIYNGYIYGVNGDYNDAAAMANTRYAPLNAISQTARYSRLIDIGDQNVLDSLYYNGSLSGNSSVTYAAANTDGVLGSIVQGTAGSGSDPGSAGCVAGTSRYIWVNIVLDDSQRMSFGDSGSNLTDLTIYYKNGQRPPPQVRLHGGKFFYNQVLQPLDTCT